MNNHPEIPEEPDFKDWLLATREFEVTVIDYGADVLRTLQEWSPDIVILDYDLKNDAKAGDYKHWLGSVIAKNIRRDHPEFNHIPFLILTQWYDIAKAEELSAEYSSEGIFWMSKGDLELRRLAYMANILFRWNGSRIE